MAKEYLENRIVDYLRTSKTPPKRVGIIFALLVISAGIFFAIKWNEAEERHILLEEKEVSGILVKCKDMTRGSYAVSIESAQQIENYEFSNFRDIERLQIGDSIYKQANSLTIHLFKKTPTGFIENGSEEIGF